jgi:hypothetical protein
MCILLALCESPPYLEHLDLAFMYLLHVVAKLYSALLLLLAAEFSFVIFRVHKSVDELIETLGRAYVVEVLFFKALVAFVREILIPEFLG